MIGYQVSLLIGRAFALAASRGGEPFDVAELLSLAKGDRRAVVAAREHFARGVADQSRPACLIERRALLLLEDVLGVLDPDTAVAVPVP